MQKSNSIYPGDSDCVRKVRAIDDTIHILSGKWKVAIISHLCFKQMRYSELLKDINGIAGKVLSRELKDLEMNGLIIREVTAGSPVSVTYAISEYGKTLKELTDAMAAWGLQHRERIFKLHKAEVAEACFNTNV
ncbi:transcriptional regulator, HxlR family [Filimonas lacunae]|uniref:Transcriptional regulator, HxlR family n=1 Tax=Filimonas lacunae TaxID=477680 RepID=A0A173MDG1_9BACT|nr:helix-turn-helix domain-containing protein [Filimonas lacunae]BAV05560.1 transcriptional regulator, HxlR family [Filimonas lacunae]SIT29372.1 transcriptional regulator, HxlR family [Filimonas lacunae]